MRFLLTSEYCSCNKEGFTLRYQIRLEEALEFALKLDDMNSKRLDQLKEAWIQNVIKVKGLNKEDAEKMYDKIQPYKNLPSGVNTKNESTR